MRGLFRQILTRPPADDETALLVKFFDTQRQRFATNQPEAARVSGSESGDAIERAAWTALARALINLDEAITRS